jgi:hypothetical protein
LEEWLEIYLRVSRDSPVFSFTRRVAGFEVISSKAFQGFSSTPLEPFSQKINPNLKAFSIYFQCCFHFPFLHLRVLNAANLVWIEGSFRIVCLKLMDWDGEGCEGLRT